ncbi:MAG: 3-hydroxyacyl-CoA dehydrogenase NAD-binding domain-containing protein [Candidatus Omnitrophota bacterium]|nr:3-hydroxyacyl-CoA dehydrogenase NAD-binding domain-containing protein [Candidatus Omnitrophota bacterium]
MPTAETQVSPQAWKLREEKGIGILELDQAATEVNVLTSGNIAEFRDHVAAIARRKDLKALIITSAKKRIFIAGADIREIEGISTEQEAFDKAHQGKVVLQMLEDLPMPTIAVINGACLGGGYELALAADYRVASFSPNVKIGLPEVNLGILPGFGGSIRLPKLLGLLKALPLILAGRIVSAEDALRYGMVDKLFAEKSLLEDTIHFAKDLIAQVPGAMRKKGKTHFVNWFLEKTPAGRRIVFGKARKDVLKKTKGFYPAPVEILDLLQKTYGKNPSRAYKLESKHFAKLAVTEVSKNLIKLFFLSEKYKKYAWTAAKVPSAKVKKCGIVGAGVMGGGIAQLVSSKNIPVRIKDINEEALGGALREARRVFDGALKRRKIKKHDLEYKMGLISVGLTNAGLKSADMLVEAVVENMDIKKKVFAELSEIASPDAVLTSNTSSLSITEMASVCKNPARVVGLHFFNPVHRMPLVEVIRASQTSDETVERTVQFARGLGKTVIVVKDAPGFLVNRLLLPYLNESAYMMQEGLTPDVIDKIARDFGMPMGPVELTDQVGIDVGYKVAHILHAAFGDRMKVAPILETVYKKGFLGVKSGSGFYRYRAGKKDLNPGVTFGKATGATPSPEDILKRMVYIMINEAARCLDEKIIDGPATVDIGMVMGTGFPPFRAGLLAYADSVGAANIVRDLKRFQETIDAERFAPAPFLEKLAENNSGFFTQ